MGCVMSEKGKARRCGSIVTPAEITEYLLTEYVHEDAQPTTSLCVTRRPPELGLSLRSLSPILQA